MSNVGPNLRNETWRYAVNCPKRPSGCLCRAAKVKILIIWSNVTCEEYGIINLLKNNIGLVKMMSHCLVDSFTKLKWSDLFSLVGHTDTFSLTVRTGPSDKEHLETRISGKLEFKENVFLLKNWTFELRLPQSEGSPESVVIMFKGRSILPNLQISLISFQNFVSDWRRFFDVLSIICLQSQVCCLIFSCQTFARNCQPLKILRTDSGELCTTFFDWHYAVFEVNFLWVRISLELEFSAWNSNSRKMFLL